MTARRHKPPMCFATCLRALRKKAGLSAERLAAAAGLARAAVYKLEAGDADPKWSTVCALAKALGVSPNHFAGRAG